MRHTVGQAYISGALAYGWQDITTDRTVTVAGVDHLRAEFNASTFSGRLEGGYLFAAPWIGGIGITPHAAGQFATFDLLERFQAKWMPVRVKKTRQNKKIEPRSDSIGTEKALAYAEQVSSGANTLRSPTVRAA